MNRDFSWADIVDRLNDPCLVVDNVAQTIVYSNHAAAAFFNRTLEEMNGISVPEIVHGIPSLSGGSSHDIAVVLSDGKTVTLSLFPSGDDVVVAIFRNCTVSAVSENDTGLPFDYFRSLVDLAADAILMGDSAGNIVFMNARAVEITGYSPDEMIGKNISVLFSEDEARRSPLRYDVLLEGKILCNERYLLRKDKSLIHIEMNSRRMPDGRHQALIRDISERDRYAEALKESEERFELFMRTLPAAVYIKDDEGRVVFTNQYLDQLFGWENSSGKSTFDLRPCDVASA
ncbi:MAG: PAS domain S-box protein, partial [Spirochaetota bacterium]